MTWKQFYDGYLCWSDSTVSSRLLQVSDLQNADSTEIVDCCQCIDEALARRLLHKAEKVQLPSPMLRLRSLLYLSVTRIF